MIDKNQESVYGGLMSNYFAEKWVSEKISLVTGLFQLTYDGRWQCAFASEDCLRILCCIDSDFMEIFKELPALTAYNASRKTVSEILEDMAAVQEPCSFISVRSVENSRNQYIKGTMVVTHNRDGLLYILGQITDVSDEQAREMRLEDLEITHRAGVEMSGRCFYRYIIRGRQAVVPPEMEKFIGVSGLVENMPEHENVIRYIAPQSLDSWLNLFDAIDRGEKGGIEDIFLQIGDDDALVRRCRVEFVGIADEEGNPESAILAYRDITEEYEREHQQWLDRNGLLQVAQMAFPEIIAMNLTKKTYRFIQHYDAIALNIPQEGSLEQMLLLTLKNIMPEDQENFKTQLFLEGQLQAIQQGKERITVTYRQHGDDGVWHWMESVVVHQENPYNDDVLTFAVSRNIDQQKAQEDILRQALADSVEKLEDWLYYNGLSNQAFPGLIYIGYEDGRPSPYTVGKLAERLQCDPKELSLLTSPRIPKEDRAVVRAAYEDAEQSEEKDLCVEYRIELAQGGMAWVYNHAIPFTDRDGAAGYIHFLTDTTKEHTLMEQVRTHMEEKLQENEETFRIVSQHSNRILYKYDLKSGTTRPWNQGSAEQDILSHLYNGNYTDDALSENPFVMPDSLADVKAFFTDIYSGMPTGETNVHVKLTDGGLRWYHFKFSNIFDGGEPSTALISIEDVTERHEHEVAYRRFVQSMEVEGEGRLMHIESDLTADRVERVAGQFVSAEDRKINCSHSDFRTLVLDSKFTFDNPEESHRYFSCENLKEQYIRGERTLKSEWKVYFNDGTRHWLEAKTVLTADPYNSHVKAFIRIKDITEKHEERLSIQQRADFDTMTGLLRKDVGEARIKSHLAADRERGGILILLDLDDLKDINDNLGHQQGDAAIIGIADTLKKHFRSDDILIRAGGDEFMVFLPSAEHSIDSVEVSIENLLRKISGIFIGSNKERNIHCSVGCAIEMLGIDTYDALFKRADTALYHVKRNGKNNYIFYVPEMEQADYEFRSKRLLSMESNRKFEVAELQYLIRSIVTFYQLVLSVNVSSNAYYMMEEVKDGVFSRVPTFGSLDGFVDLAARAIHPEDVQTYYEHLSREGLMRAYEQGKESVRQHFRFFVGDQYRWVECMAIFYINDQGDVCDFTLLRWDDDWEKPTA